MLTKKGLEKELSKLKVFEKPKVKLEQYPTPSDIAADILWNAFMQGDIQDKVIADLGAGTGILGIGALLLGAKKVIFVEADESVIYILKTNLKSVSVNGKFEVQHSVVSEIDFSVDTILMNPPFGTKTKHADKEFLEKAFTISKIIYSFHKEETSRFVNSIAKDFNFKITHIFHYEFPLRKTQEFHKKPIKKIDVDCYRFIS